MELHVCDYNSDINVIDNRIPISLISIRTTCHLKTIPPDALCNTKVNVKLIRRKLGLCIVDLCCIECLCFIRE
jgi:hypothetical protein